MTSPSFSSSVSLFQLVALPSTYSSCSQTSFPECVFGYGFLTQSDSVGSFLTQSDSVCFLSLLISPMFFLLLFLDDTFSLAYVIVLYK